MGQEGVRHLLLPCAELAGDEDISPSPSWEMCCCIAAKSRGFSARLGSLHLCSARSTRCTSAGFSLRAATGWGGERRGEQQRLIKTQPPWP